MKQSLLRGLDASGLTVADQLRTRSLTALVSEDPSGNCWLVIYPNPLKTSWPVIHRFLAEQELSPQLIRISGEVLIAVAESSAAKKVLAGFDRRAKLATKSEIYLEGKGFGKTNLSKKFEVKFLIGPLVILGLTLGIAISSQPVTPPQEESVASCRTKVSPNTLGKFLEGKLENNSELQRFGVTNFEYELASVEVTQGSGVGDLVLLQATISCPDGTGSSYSYRYNLESGGPLSSVFVGD